MPAFCFIHRLVLAAKVLLPWISALIAILVLSMLPAQGEVIISGTGQTLVSPNVSHTVSARARLSIAGDTLRLVLENTSPNDTTDPADALSSFYFNIARGSLRPQLTFTSANGPLYKIIKNGTDQAYHYMPSPIVGAAGTYTSGTGTSDLRALKAGDQTWQLKAMDLSKNPFEGFGVGTVANSGLSPNNFDPTWVGNRNTAIDFSIYHLSHNGDINPNGTLQNAYLLQNSGTFTFTLSGSTPWSESDIRKEAVFGFGTAPDGKIVVIPEPSACVLALLGAAAIVGRYRFVRKRLARHQAMS